LFGVELPTGNGGSFCGLLLKLDDSFGSFPDLTGQGGIATQQCLDTSDTGERACGGNQLGCGCTGVVDVLGQLVHGDRTLVGVACRINE